MQRRKIRVQSSAMVRKPIALEFRVMRIASLARARGKHHQARTFIATLLALQRFFVAIERETMQSPRLLRGSLLDRRREFGFEDVHVVQVAENRLKLLQQPDDGSGFGQFRAQRFDEVAQALDLDSGPVHILLVIRTRNRGESLPELGNHRIEDLEQGIPKRARSGLVGIVHPLSDHSDCVRKFPAELSACRPVCAPFPAAQAAQQPALAGPLLDRELFALL